jgi:hypothetical protein
VLLLKRTDALWPEVACNSASCSRSDIHTAFAKCVHPVCAPQVSDSFPFKWINKKWKEGFYVTSMATSHTRWAVVMSRNAGFVDQVREAGNQRGQASCVGL